MRTFLLLLIACSPVWAAAPNVVLIIGDDQAWNDYGFMGHPDIQTPHLDALAAESLVYRRGYVVSSLCRPSLATLATGLYPHEHGITGNDPGDRKERSTYLPMNARWIEMFQEAPQIAGMLGDAGYVSHQSGKWWEGACRCGEFTAGMTHGDPERGGRHGDAGLEIGRESMDPIFNFIDASGEKPFFIWYAPFLPHRPHNPPERLLSKYEKADRPKEIAEYFAMCEWLDETVGELMGFLEERGERDNTMVLFLADNGWIQPLRSSEAYRSPFGAARGKRSPYDGGLRTPVLVNYRGKVAPGVSDTPVNSIDIAPTIAAGAGVERAARWPGVNLMDEKAVEERGALFGEIFRHDAVDISRPATSLRYRWMIDGDWKLIVPYAVNLPDEGTELFDLGADPWERNNLAGSMPERVDAMLKRLNGWWNPEE